MKLAVITPLLGGLLISTNALADTPQKDKDDGLTGSAKLGFIYSKSDDTSSSLNSSGALQYQKNKITHALSASSYYTNSSDDDDGVNKYTLDYKVSYTFYEEYATYLSNQYKHSQYGTYRHVYDITMGIQNDLVDSETATLTVGGGPGYRYSKRQADDDDYPNQEENDLILNAFILGSKEISKSLSIGGSADVDYGQSNTEYTLGANLTNKLIDDVSLILDTQYIYNTDVSDDDNHDEIYSTVSISYAF